jgi:hypothetical protein
MFHLHPPYFTGSMRPIFQLIWLGSCGHGGNPSAAGLAVGTKRVRGASSAQRSISKVSKAIYTVSCQQGVQAVARGRQWRGLLCGRRGGSRGGWTGLAPAACPCATWPQAAVRGGCCGLPSRGAATGLAAAAATGEGGQGSGRCWPQVGTFPKIQLIHVYTANERQREVVRGVRPNCAFTCRCCA